MALSLLHMRLSSRLECPDSHRAAPELSRCSTSRAESVLCLLISREKKARREREYSGEERLRMSKRYPPVELSVSGPTHVP
jgi:hypothetical protein